MSEPIDANGVALLTAARAAAARALAAAHDRCGAAVRTADGAIHLGATRGDGAATSLVACAERVAVWAARGAGPSPITCVALWMPAAAGPHPCGSCLQVLLELAPGAEILVQRGDAPPGRLAAETLMPDAFETYREVAAPPTGAREGQP